MMLETVHMASALVFIIYYLFVWSMLYHDIAIMRFRYSDNYLREGDMDVFHALLMNPFPNHKQICQLLWHARIGLPFFLVSALYLLTQLRL